jgi:transposase
MAEGCLLMSAGERERSHLIRATVEKRLGQREAAERVGIGLRQFKRLVRSWKQDGDAGLLSRQRGQRSNRRLADQTMEQIERHLRETYSDFGPTLAVEKLAEREGIVVSRETVRQIQVRLGLHKPKRRRQQRVFQSRPRRPRFGELVQIDGSPHDWLEERGPRCTLLVFIDDATGRLLGLRFVLAECSAGYIETLRACVLEHGCPLAFYSDRHGIFRVNAKDAESGDGKTEFGRIVERLGIELINANTPQAKGRVERANQTLQDRLIKEMRLAEICSIEEANAFLPSYIAGWNARFAVSAHDATSACRPWTKTATELDDALARREERTLTKALTFSSGGIKFCVKTSGPGTALRGVKVTLYHYADGRMDVHYKDRVLAWTAYGSYPVPAPTEDEKTLDLRIDRIVAAQQVAARSSLAVGNQ